MFTRRDQGVNISLSLIYGIVGSGWVLLTEINFNDGSLLAHNK